jgi:hypothetical protein
MEKPVNEHERYDVSYLKVPAALPIYVPLGALLDQKENQRGGALEKRG